jgi:hypothetical protein
MRSRSAELMTAVLEIMPPVRIAVSWSAEIMLLPARPMVPLPKPKGASLTSELLPTSL